MNDFENASQSDLDAATDAASSDRVRAGWYPDARDVELERFWDGLRWTSRVRAIDFDVEIERQDDRIQKTGLLTAILVPPVGFVLGAVLALRARRVERGAGLMFVSLVAWFTWMALLAATF